MKTTEILIAGFGGQGSLFAGKLLAIASLKKGLEVSWLPSYGPEMRGGTANCSVIISDSPIGSPIVQHPDVLIALNKPSFEKYEKATKPGGIILTDANLVDIRSERDDVKAFYINASDIARECGHQNLPNIVLLGRALKETGLFTPEDIWEGILALLPENRASARVKNMKAIYAGMAAE